MTISAATLRMVWARWSRLLVSQLAVARQSVRKVFSVGVAGLLGDRGIVDAVDQHARQDVGIELDLPVAAAAPRARTHRAPPTRPAPRSKARPGLGSSSRSSPSMSIRSSRSQPTARVRRARSWAAIRSRLSSRRCIIGSSRSFSRSCSARHSFTSRAKTPTGSVPCSLSSTASTVASGAPSWVGDRLELDGEIAGLVEAIDQELGDQPLGRIGNACRPTCAPR